MPTIPGLDDCIDQPDRYAHPKPVIQSMQLSRHTPHYSPGHLAIANQENCLNASQLLFPSPGTFGNAKVALQNAPSTPTMSLLCSPRIISAATGLCTPTSSTGRVRFTFGDEQRSDPPSCRKILTFSHSGISKSCYSKVPATVALPPTNHRSSSVSKLTSSSKKQPVASPNIRIKQISREEAYQRKSRAQLQASNLHFVPDIQSSPCQKFPISGLNQTDHQHFHSDSIFNDLESELPAMTNFRLFSTESEGQETQQQSFDILDAFNEETLDISNLFAEQTSQFMLRSSAIERSQPERASKDSSKQAQNSLGPVLTENESQTLFDLLCDTDILVDEDQENTELQSEDVNYLNFLIKIREPVKEPSNPFVDDNEESDSDCEIYQDENALSESCSSECEEENSQESQEVGNGNKSQNNASNGLISERELFALYEETIQSHQTGAAIKHYSPSSSGPNENQSFTEVQIEQLHEQLAAHLQTMVQTISLLMEGKLFDVMVCIKSHLQMLFELKYFDDFFEVQINQEQQKSCKRTNSRSAGRASNALQIAARSIFHVKGIEKLGNFYGLLKRFNQDFSFSFNAPSKVRLLPDRYPTNKQLMYSKLQINQLFIPPLLQKVMALFQEDFNRNLMISWGSTKSNPKNEINFSCENSRCKFLPSEDDLLLIGLKRYCLNWEVIQNKILPSKTAKQVAIRYKNLTTRRAPPNPIKEFHFSLGRPLDEQEEELLYKGVQHLGKDFAKISKLYLPYRPAAFLRKVWIEMDQSRRLNPHISANVWEEQDFFQDGFMVDNFSCQKLLTQDKFPDAMAGYSIPGKVGNPRPKKTVKVEFSLEDALLELSRPVKQDVFDLEAELFSVK